MKKRSFWVALIVLAALACCVWAVSEGMIIVPADLPINPNAKTQTAASASEEEAIPDTAPDDLPAVQETFLAQYAQNNDLVGLLTFGPVQAQPVVQSDNTFYMTHGFDGKESVAGALFLDECNTLWPQDKNLLIYGHNMKDGSMFGDFDKFRDVQYLKEHPIIYFTTIYDATDVGYVPFALFDASMTPGNADYFKLRRPNFETEAEMQAYLDDARARSIITVPVDVAATDELITLVTCSYTQDDGRFLIVGRKLREGETTESIAALMANAK